MCPENEEAKQVVRDIYKWLDDTGRRYKPIAIIPDEMYDRAMAQALKRDEVFGAVRKEEPSLHFDHCTKLVTEAEAYEMLEKMVRLQKNGLSF